MSGKISADDIEALRKRAKEAGLGNVSINVHSFSTVKLLVDKWASKFTSTGR
jgi:hypothetical protein